MSLSRRGFIRALSVFLSSVPLFSKKGAATLPAPVGTAVGEFSDLRLWYREPADRWTDALPLGNGRLGAMVFGGVGSERIALNEDTLWSGAPREWDNPAAKDHLSVVRSMVIGNQAYEAADQECRKMQGPFTQAFEPLGDLIIHFAHGDESTDYERSLDLDSAVSTVTYTSAGNRIMRETFVSAPNQIVMARIMGSKPGALNCTLVLKSQ